MERQWQQELIQNVTALVTNKLEVWSNILEKLGIDSINLSEYTESVERNTADLYDAMIAELHKELMDVTESIEELLKKSAKLCKQLSIDLPSYGQKQERGLFQEHRLLKEQVMKQQAMVDERLSEINKLNEEEAQLCASLGVSPTPMLDYPLPNADAIKAFVNHICSLKEERLSKYTTFTKLRDEIITIATELKLKPSLQFEQMVFAGNDDIVYTQANMDQLRDYHKYLVDKQQSVISDIELIRNKIEDVWKILNIDIKERDLFRQKHVGNSLDTLSALKEELRRCEEIKRANIKVFIDKLRKNLTDMWNKLYYTETQREEFKYHDSSFYTEDLLDIHERELMKLEMLYNHHRELFTLLEKHKRLWNKLSELERKAEQPDRFKNRGGQLLQEEKERNKVSKQIPIIEVKLRELAAAYEDETGKQFLCWGESVEEYINKLHANRAEERKLKLSARKEQRGNLKLTPAKSAVCLYSAATSTTPRQTPVRPPTCNKRKQTPHTTEKNSRLAVAKQTAGIRTGPPRLTVMSSRIRRSLEGKKDSSRKKLPVRRNLQSNKTPTEYDDFQKNLAVRSTMFADDDGLQLPPIEVQKTPKRTPQKSERHLQPATSASEKSRLTPLKLIF